MASVSQEEPHSLAKEKPGKLFPFSADLFPSRHWVPKSRRQRRYDKQDWLQKSGTQVGHTNSQESQVMAGNGQKEGDIGPGDLPELYLLDFRRRQREDPVLARQYDQVVKIDERVLNAQGGGTQTGGRSPDKYWFRRRLLNLYSP
ncbi:hypothetical protein FKM82_022087 [Ascaphus truei]